MSTILSSAAASRAHDLIGGAKTTAKTAIKWLLIEGYGRRLLPARVVQIAFRVIRLRNE